MNLKLFVICIIIFNCISINAQIYFEGIVKFSIEYESDSPYLTNDYLETEFGKSMIAKVMNDRYSVEYFSESDLGNLRIIYYLNKGYGLMKYSNVDTLYKIGIDEYPGELIAFEIDSINTKNLLSAECNSVIIKYKSNDTTYYEEVEGRYYYHENFKLNPTNYIKHKDSFWDKFISATGSISVLNEINYVGFYKTFMEVVEIEERQFGNEEFVFDVNLPIVEQ